MVIGAGGKPIDTVTLTRASLPTTVKVRAAVLSIVVPVLGKGGCIARRILETELDL